MPTTIDATTAAPDRTELPDDAPVRMFRPPTMKMPVLLPPPVGLVTPDIAPPPPVPFSPAAPSPAAEPPPATHSTTGPSSVFSADVASLPADFGVPMLPAVAIAAPSAPATRAATFDIDEFLTTPGPARQTPPEPRGRGLRRLLLVALLASGAWAGTTYGPGLYDEYVGDATEVGEAEAAAPLAFPAATAVGVPIRTAEFVLVGLPESPGATYRITTDFETAVSQVDITREDGPALQILTYGDDAMIRRADAEEWYLLDRGQFPLDGRLARADWVRTLDELLPDAVRGGVLITDSTESTISSVPTRHLTLSIDPAMFDSIAADDLAGGDPSIMPVPAMSEVDGEVATPTAAAPVTNPLTAPGALIDIELWIDGNGLVRQVMGAPGLGAQTITILRTTRDPWIPAYPAADEIAPLTASALVDLGL